MHSGVGSLEVVTFACHTEASFQLILYPFILFIPSIVFVAVVVVLVVVVIIIIVVVVVMIGERRIVVVVVVVVVQ